MSNPANKTTLLSILRKGRDPVREQPKSRKRPSPVKAQMLPLRGVSSEWPESEEISSLLRNTPRLVIPRRGEASIHVSTLLGGCLRQVAISALFKISPPAEAPLHALSLIFAYGNAVHSFVQMAMSRSAPDRLYGNWSCKCETSVVGPCTLSQIPKDTVCEVCGTAPERYVELFLKDAEAGYGGTPDVLLLCKDQKVQVTEIKSSSDKKWDELEAPEPSHILQPAIYRELVRSNGLPVTDSFTVLYAVKNRGMKWPYKEFVMDASQYEARAAAYIDMAREANRAIHEGGALPEKICSSPGCNRARSCHAAALCFTL